MVFIGKRTTLLGVFPLLCLWDIDSNFIINSGSLQRTNISFPRAARVPYCSVNSEVMDVNSQQPKRRDNVLSTLSMTIEVLNLAKEASSITPAKAAFGSVSIILAMIRVRSSIFHSDRFRPHIRVGFNDQPNGLR